MNTHKYVDKRYTAAFNRDYLTYVGTRMEDSDQGNLSCVGNVENNILTKGLMY